MLNHPPCPTYQFLWGSGTSAFQTEGAWNQDGKGVSIWDYFTHSSDSETADVASDSYNYWEEDVAALGYLGVRSYSFSLSWPRLFPDGNATGEPNAAAFDGVQVFGYLAWSLVDGFEWNYGYGVRRGLFYIDFKQPNRTRLPKTTAQYFKQIVASNAETHLKGTGHWT
uniref:Klotho beta n=1 Tax=Cyprinodon variegatus TaxID=28743 RepID=A0A3Q2CVA5_CYPVA